MIYLLANEDRILIGAYNINLTKFLQLLFFYKKIVGSYMQCVPKRKKNIGQKLVAKDKGDNVVQISQ